MPILPINAVFSAGATLRDSRREPHMAFNFLVELEGILAGGFMEVSGLESEIRTEEYREGGVNDFVHYFPTRVEYPRLILSHGVTDSNTLWSWYDAAATGNIRRKNGTIMLLDRQLVPVMWWNFKDAYPVRWVGPQLNAADATGFAVERLELVHHGLTKPAASLALSVARIGAGVGGFTGTQQLKDQLPVNLPI